MKRPATRNGQSAPDRSVHAWKPWRTLGGKRDRGAEGKRPVLVAVDNVDEWLPKVHTTIANLKRFLLGTLHGVSSPKLQKYLDEFVYRYNRRFWCEATAELTVKRHCN